MKNVPSTHKVRIIRPNTQDSESHIVQGGPKHCGLVFNVPSGSIRLVGKGLRSSVATSKKRTNTGNEVYLEKTALTPPTNMTTQNAYFRDAQGKFRSPNRRYPNVPKPSRQGLPYLSAPRVCTTSGKQTEMGLWDPLHLLPSLLPSQFKTTMALTWHMSPKRLPTTRPIHNSRGKTMRGQASHGYPPTLLLPGFLPPHPRSTVAVFPLLNSCLQTQA